MENREENAFYLAGYQHITSSQLLPDHEYGLLDISITSS
jgi:hypothetical protein